jgi:hypothetical protein
MDQTTTPSAESALSAEEIHQDNLTAFRVGNKAMRPRAGASPDGRAGMDSPRTSSGWETGPGVPREPSLRRGEDRPLPAAAGGGGEAVGEDSPLVLIRIARHLSKLNGK